MTDRNLEASSTVIEAMARTEAILRQQAAVAERRPDPTTPPLQRTAGIGAWLDAWRSRLTARIASADDPRP